MEILATLFGWRENGQLAMIPRWEIYSGKPSVE